MTTLAALSAVALLDTTTGRASHFPTAHGREGITPMRTEPELIEHYQAGMAELAAHREKYAELVAKVEKDRAELIDRGIHPSTWK